MQHLLRAYWNGWLTSRRLQRHGSVSKCIYGCIGDDKDSLEQYALCPFVWQFSQKYLGLRPPDGGPEQRMRAFFLIDAPAPRDDAVGRAALRLAACYRVHNAAR